jgi:hypothetical protein
METTLHREGYLSTTEWKEKRIGQGRMSTIKEMIDEFVSLTEVVVQRSFLHGTLTTFDMILFIPSEPDIASWTEESNTPRGPPDHHLAGIQYHEPWSRTCKARQTLETLALSGLPFDDTERDLGKLDDDENRQLLD